MGIDQSFPTGMEEEDDISEIERKIIQYFYSNHGIRGVDSVTRLKLKDNVGSPKEVDFNVALKNLENEGFITRSKFSVNATDKLKRKFI